MAGMTRSGATSVPVKYSKEVSLAGAVATTVVAGPTVPAGTVILGGGIRVTEAHAGTSTDMTLDVGITGGDVDVFVDGFDMDGAVVGAYANNGVQTQTIVSAEDTVDVLVATQTGTTTAGKVEVFVYGIDVTGPNRPGVAAVGS